MIFPNLWGLLLLLAIPVLILLYVIKREYRERAVSDTYLWRLSEKFLKKRLPIKRASVFLTFLLQLIILSLFAVSAMQPAMTIGQFSGKIVVIDASASMLTEQDGVSRFNAAVEKAKDLAESGLCASMTVIVASDTPACLVLGGNVSEALDALDNATCGYGGMNLYETMKLVREASSRIGLAQVILYTDTEFADVENVEVVDMRRGEKNLAVTELTHTAGKFQGTLVSYGEDREVSAGLCIDGEVVETQTVSCPNGEPATVKFDATAATFESATLLVDVEDALEIDNSFSVAGPDSNPVSVLVLGSEVLFFEKAFEALGNCEVTVKEKYKLEDDGQYDLYVFSSCVPGWDSIPRTGVTLGFTQYNNDSEQFSKSILTDLRIREGYYGKTGLSPQYDMRLEIDPLWVGMDSALQDVYVRHVNSCTLRGNSVVNGTVGIWEPVLGSKSAGRNMALRRILDNGARHYIF
ncbi:MAG: VWA domain-containing protein, partial [Ruminococcaceae bacterium]|nr:VWA domain-containing protein [Oscillospiraceae bacterium]